MERAGGGQRSRSVWQWAEDQTRTQTADVSGRRTDRLRISCTKMWSHKRLRVVQAKMIRWKKIGVCCPPLFHDHVQGAVPCTVRHGWCRCRCRLSGSSGNASFAWGEGNRQGQGCVGGAGGGEIPVRGCVRECWKIRGSTTLPSLPLNLGRNGSTTLLAGTPNPSPA